MQDKFKDELVSVVQSATEVLNEEDALAIVKICKQAADREIANITEEYLASRICEGADEGGAGT